MTEKRPGRTIHEAAVRIELEILQLRKRQAARSKSAAQLIDAIKKLHRVDPSGAKLAKRRQALKQIESSLQKSEGRLRELTQKKREISQQFEQRREAPAQRRIQREFTQLRRGYELLLEALHERMASIKDNSDRDENRYDLFISHASEDKVEVARPLADALSSRGLRVWFDEFSLNIGDSLRASIDRGLSDSTFGLVVLSTHFFAKNWTQYELNSLVSKEMTGSKVILPIWHKLTKDEVLRFSPFLVDKVALNTSLLGITEIADKIVGAVKPKGE